MTQRARKPTNKARANANKNTDFIADAPAPAAVGPAALSSARIQH